MRANEGIPLDCLQQIVERLAQLTGVTFPAVGPVLTLSGGSALVHVLGDTQTAGPVLVWRREGDWVVLLGVDEAITCPLAAC